jgi:(R,R)-butanediol dehydrogenase / meso-butanediol dehydrogenase / diacetyl reductase
MKAAFYVGKKSFRVEEVEPPPPAPGEVQVAVAYCGICGSDMHVYHGDMDWRVGDHRVIGHESAGAVAAVGPGVTGFAEGDRVVARPLVSCGVCPACKRGYAHVCQNLQIIGFERDGAFQQMFNVPADNLHKIPDALSMRQAALIEPLAVAVHCVGRGAIKPGEDVLVVGGGPIGLLVALVAQHEGGKVLISEPSAFRREMAEGLGLETVDPRAVHIKDHVFGRTGGKGADLVFEVSSTQSGVDAMTDAAAVRGRIVMVSVHTHKPAVDMFRLFASELEIIGARVYEARDFDRAIDLLASGAIECEAMITGVSELDDIQSAFAFVDGNPNAMKMLVRCGHWNE